MAEDTNRLCDWMPLVHELYCYMFVWYRLKCKHGEGLDRARRNRGHCEDGKQGKILHRISFILPRRYLFASKRHLIYVVPLQRQICIQDCLFRDTTLKWEWLAGLRRSPVPEIGMVLQTTAKGKRLSQFGKNLRIQFVAGVRVLTRDLFSSVTASSHHVQHGLSSGSAPAAVCQIMWRVWVIRLVTVQMKFVWLTAPFLMHSVTLRARFAGFSLK